MIRLDPSTLADVLLLAAFLCLSALFSAGEFAFFSVSRSEIEEENSRRARMALRMLSSPQELMIKLLVSSSFCNVLVALFALRIAWRAYPEGTGHLVAAAVALLLVAIMIAILTRLLPRVYVAHDPVSAVVAVTRPVYVLFLPLYPFVKGVYLLTQGLFLAGAQAREMVLKAGQLRAIARAEGEGAGIGSDEQEMINGIFEMRDTLAREVMVPRIDMVCAEATTTVGEAMKVISEGGHSRIPVYNKTVDNIIGIMHARDLIGFIAGGDVASPISGILRNAYFIPESMKVDSLLKELRKRKTHMAVVVDEFGGVVGLVTLEDVIEEIVGEIYDEYDEEEKLVQVVSPDEVLVAGKTHIEELNEILGTGLNKEEDYDTIAGYLYNLLGKVPSQGDEHEADGLRFVVDRVAGQRIERVRIIGKGLGGSAKVEEL
ncbi:MAG: hemolysin family protein [bacterium]|jgi:CBS domain containing-hemolysin-like protein